jgi:CubicO group peptidase (beta-lactamase class C family)
MYHFEEREDNSWKYAGGGMESDAKTLAKFGNDLLRDRLVKRSTRELMWSRAKIAGGEVSDYGLGFRINDDGTVGHSGAQQGCRSYFTIDPKNKIVVVIMTNTSHGGGLGKLSSSLLKIWQPAIPIAPKLNSKLSSGARAKRTLAGQKGKPTVGSRKKVRSV